MLGRRPRTDLSLVAVALLLLGLWFLLGRDSALDEANPKPFAALNEQSPKHLTLLRGTERITLRYNHMRQQKGGRYEFPDAPSRPVDPAAVDRLLRGLSEQEILRDVPAPVDRIALGLQPPELTLEFELGGELSAIALGASSRTSERERYAQVTIGKHSRVVVLSRTETATIDVAPDSLGERRLLDWVPSDIAEISLQRKFSLIRVQQQENGRYLLQGDPPQRAKRKDIEALLLALTQLAIERDLDPKTTRIEDRHVNLVVSMSPFSDRELSPATLTFGGQCPLDPKLLLVIAKSSTTRAGCVSPALIERFPTEASALVDSRLFFLHNDEIETLSLERPGARFVLERKGAGFVLREPKDEAVALDAGNALLDRFIGLSGVSSGRCTTVLSTLPTTVTLRSGVVGKAGPTNETVHLGAPLTDGRVPVCRDDGQQLLITSEQATAFDLDSEILRSPQLLALPIDAIDEIVITNPAGRQRFATSDGLHLSLVEPNLPGDPASIESLKEHLAQLSTIRHLPRQSYESRLQAPHTTVQFWASVRDRPREKHELCLYGKEHGSVLATLDDKLAPFLLPAATTEFLEGLLVDRSLYRIKATDRAFSLSRGNEHARCERTEKGFVCPSRAIAEEQRGRLVATLSELRAIRVDRTAVPRSAKAMTLAVYGATGEQARFRLDFLLDTVDPQNGVLFAVATGSKLRMTYKLTMIKSLEALLSNPAPPP